MAANNDLGSLSYSLNIDISQLPNTIRDVERQLSAITTIADISTRVDSNQLIGAIKQALMAEDFKLKVTLDDSFKNAISNAASLLNNATNGSGGTNTNAQLGYIDTLIQKLKELETQYKNLPKGADTSGLVQEFSSVQAELNKAGKNLSSVFNKSWADINKMAESTIGDLKSKIKSLEQYKLNIPLSNPAEITRVSDLINKLKGDISALFQTQQVNPFQLPENSIKEIEAKIKALREVRNFSPINSQDFVDADKALGRLRDKMSHIGKLNLSQSLALPERSIEDIKNKLKALESLKIRVPIDSYRFQEASKEIERLKKLIAEVNNTSKASKSFTEVMGMDTNSLNQITAKLNEIRKLKGDISFNNPNGLTQLNALNKAEADLLRLQQQRLGVNRQINESYQSQNNIIQKLSGAALAYFSVQKIEQFVTRVRDTTGEFEKQRIALTAILQSREDANRLFNQVVELGLKSPFSIMQLNGYVRQLSAFQIETENLFETTKRLADISAGLNVEMGRLILAYGQVRAAEYLRGQEVRQFTEAGIPLIGKLAEQFSKLEGRAISVAEVFDRISNREVTFQNVKDALWEMTDAGGIFFNMQEELADSLAAKWKNLQDVLDVMYNSIGTDYSEWMKGAIDLLTQLASHWQDVLNIMTGLATVYGAYKTTLLVVTAIQKINNAVLREAVLLRQQNAAANIVMGKSALIAAAQTTVLRSALEGVDKATKANKIALIMAAIAALGFVIYKVATHTNEWEKAIKSVREEGDKLTASIENEQAKIDRLFGSLDSLTKGTKEYEDQKQAIIDQYGGYLRGLGLEIEQLNNVEAAYKAVSFAARQSAIDRAIAAKTEDAGNTKVKEDEKTISELRKAIGQSEKYRDKRNIREEEAIVQSILQDIRNGGELSKEVQDIVSKLTKQVYIAGHSSNYGMASSGSIATVNQVQDQVNALKKNGKKYQEVIDEVESTLGIQRNDYMKLEYDQIKTHLDAVNKAYSEAKGTDKKIAIKALKDGKVIHMSEIELLAEKARAEEALSIKQPTKDLNLGEEYAKAKEAYEKARVLVNTIKTNKKDYSPQDLEKAEKDLERASSIFKKLGGEIDKKGGSGSKKDPLIERYKERIDLIKKASAAYKDNLKYWGEDNAKNQTLSVYGDQLKSFDLDLKDVTDSASYFNSILSNLAGDPKRLKEIRKLIFGEQDKSAQESKEDYWNNLDKEIDKYKKAYELYESVRVALGEDFAKIFTQETYEGVTISDTSFEEYFNNLMSKNADASAKMAVDLKNKYVGEVKESLSSLLNDFQTTEDKIAAIQAKYGKYLDNLEKGRIYLTTKAYEERKKLIEETRDQEIAALTATAIQMTDAYQRMFGNISEMSEKELNYLIQKWKTALAEAKRNMDGTFSISLDGQQFTTTEQQIASFTKKVLASESELRQKNPFKALKDSLAELKNDSLLKNKLNDEKNLLTKERDSAIASGDVEKAKELNDSLDDVEESLKGINAKSATTWAKMAKQIDAVIAQVLDIGKSISSIFESFGADEDTTGTLDDIMGIVGGLGDAASGVGRIMSGDIIGGVAQGVKGIAGVISSITSLSDRKHEKQIRRLQEAIDASKIAYEELGRAAAKALGNAEYDTKKLQIAELKRQQQLIQGQIKSEKDKKKTDKDKIKNWEEEYRQLGYEIEDIITEITESLTGNIKDMANEMTNALVEAFEAGDDAQEAMFKSIKNNLKQTISKQFQKTVVESALAPLFKRMNEMLGIDDQGNATYKRFTPEQVKELIGMAGDISEDVMDIFNSGGWKEIFDALTNSGELSGLSKGIQGLTEDTAQIIEAYLNTIRDVTISIMMVQENQLSILQASQLIQSQILTEVSMMSSATVSMNNAIRSALAQSQGDKGVGFRVYIQ